MPWTENKLGFYRDKVTRGGRTEHQKGKGCIERELQGFAEGPLRVFRKLWTHTFERMAQ